MKSEVKDLEDPESLIFQYFQMTKMKKLHILKQGRDMFLKCLWLQEEVIFSINM